MAFQRQNWQNNESGILRKKDETEEELLVFGYSCKLFRDDEKALYIDQGKHLIPWMGDESLRIDRYDVRGALYDLSKYEAISGQQEESFWINLSNEERRIEQLCDEERYRALTHNEDEEALYQEEELKRLHQALGSDKTYGQVSYSYEEENGETDKSVQESNQTEDADEPFVPPTELDLPQDMVVPETTKLNAIIEKTAMFIHQQGSQMEIILKMKQATNPQFEFLSYHSSLHSYYRHVLMAIKTGRYRPKIQNNSRDNKTNEENSSDQNYYLHHSLSQAPSSSFNVAPLIPSINYKPSTDCAYSMLVNKIRGNQNKFNLLNKTTEPPKETVTRDVVTIPEPIVTDNRLQADVSISSSPKIYNQNDTPCNESDEENNDSGNVLKRSSPAPIVQRPGRRKRRKRQQGAFAYNDSFDDVSVDVPQLEMDGDLEVRQEIESELPTDLKSTQPFVTPPPDVQMIIDKMASYVAKNGRDFEAIVRSKDDPRFYFLDASNVYYPYYCKKVEDFEQTDRPVENIAGGDDSNTGDNDNDSVKSYDLNKDNGADASDRSPIIVQKPNPVCFSIKRPKESEGLEIKSALPVEESSEDEDGEEGSMTNDKESNENVNNSKGSALYDPMEMMDEINASMKNNEKNNGSSNSHPEKWAEERVKDKLAAAAREKLMSKEKEKQLQLERKRRAAAFLNLIQKSGKKSSGSPDKTQPMIIGPQLPDDMKTDDKSESGEIDEDDDSNSISSPPSSVTSPDVTIIEDNKIDGLSPKVKDKDSKSTDTSLLSSSSSILHKLKRSKYSMSDKYERRMRDSLEFRHKHRKRKRSRSPLRRHRSSHTSRPHSYQISNMVSRDGKHRKHHHHRKERHHSGKERHHRDYNSSFHRRHKHYKSKKHKKKDDKKYMESSSSDNSDSE